MKRRLFNLARHAAAVLSLLLCVGTVALWVRSYWYATFIGYNAPITDTPVGWQYGLSLGGGSVRLNRKMETVNPSYRRPGELRCYDKRIPPRYDHVGATPVVSTDFLGFDYHVAA